MIRSRARTALRSLSVSFVILISTKIRPRIFRDGAATTLIDKENSHVKAGYHSSMER